MGLFGGGVGTALGAGLGFAVGGPSGAAFGAGLGGGLDTNADNVDRADASNAWSAAQYASRYQTTVKDLEAAGLNPMLAYSQGAGSAPTAQAVQFQNPVSSASQALSQYAGAEQSFSSASQAQAAVKQIDATVEKIKEETKNVPVEGDRLKFTIQLLAEQAAKTAQETQSQTITQKVLAQTVQKLKAETSLLDLDVDAAKSLDNIGRESRQLKPIVDIIRAVIK
jgi:hypothetical protein